ncbi:MAG: tRNA (guanosine(37)-N1)-methyltransferase TrmD [Oscillospiraceae bacterium]|nr:tRNA (guanosine(37)-N1)-methyltransferase TrmD [Oscillospiraceae bacterium]
MTLFPDTVGDMMCESILGRAQERGFIRVDCHQIRDYTTNKQNQVDDYPYGGGRGCVMQAQPLYDCWRHIMQTAEKRVRTIYMSPCGKVFTQEDAKRLKADYDQLIFVCGHYEGVDERFIEECVDEEISIGDFVLTGGEIPAMAVADAVCRLVPGVLPDEECYTGESHWDGLLEYPQYSRPDVWNGRRVPEILLSGDHKKVDLWRKKQSVIRTRFRRPDMYEKLDFSSKSDKKLLEEIEMEIMNDRINAYAKLLIEVGLNVQKGQTVVISAPVECAYFARLCASAAYDAGCREVVMNWADDFLTREKYLRADDSIFDSVHPWVSELYNGASEQQAAWLSIHASDPQNLSGVDPDRLLRASKSSGAAIKPFRDRQGANFFPWCVASLPIPSWAKKVFPNLNEKNAMNALWDAILTASRVYENGDPVAEWKTHCETLAKRVKTLNDYNFKYLKYKNSLGTDLTIELPENHFWAGGSEKCAQGHSFNANIPTEEVFTAPLKTGVNGVVYASRPLIVNGDIADKFSFRFENGKIIEVKAEVGQKLLETAISVDEGASYLGEVALVPYDSPISNSGILFYNTLFDENASCHLAFGAAYPCIEGGADMTQEQLAEKGLNSSIVHDDFMVGTPDLSITGVTHGGDEIPVFIDGNFAF